MEVWIGNGPRHMICFVIDESFATNVDEETSQIVKQHSDLSKSRERKDKHALVMFTFDERFYY